jgi:hypothetical protein
MSSDICFMERAMRRTVYAAVALAAASMAIGCSPVTSPLDVSGLYSLKTINGAALPAVISQTGATTITVWNDAFTLTPNGTYSEQGYKSSTTSGVISISYPVDAGNFTRRDDAITLESLLVGIRPAVLSNGTLTVVDRGLTLVYQK